MSNPWSNEKKRPFYFPPANKSLNANLDEARLPRVSAGQLARFSEETALYSSSTVLDYVFDVTSVEEFAPKGEYGVYAFKDISFALVKGSVLERDTMVSGYSSLSPNEMEELKEWYSAFL
ncbi:hypothetical protein R3P38DRAFT_3245289 [Favolaschia claudopus]|uniref:Uncharacterized protein n=1 Tax=Favolaschia claudopus TaxID=2862362 RepID=A0AAV9Z0Z5_9AGAR